MEAFGALQIRQHIQRLRQPDVYDQGPGSRGQPMGGVPAGPPNPDDDSACAVCGIIRLTFEPPAVYCTSCAQRIKRNQVLAVAGAVRVGDWLHAVCSAQVATLAWLQGCWRFRWKALPGCCLLTAVLSSGACKHSHASAAKTPVAKVEEVLMVDVCSFSQQKLSRHAPHQ